MTPIIGVNGENILEDEDKSIDCGSGKATYDESNNTLTLTNATIENPYLSTSGYERNVGVYSNVDLKIVLIGTNIIGNMAEQDLFDSGIFVSDELDSIIDISGTGSLTISAFICIEGTSDITISESNIVMNSVDGQGIKGLNKIEIKDLKNDNKIIIGAREGIVNYSQDTEDAIKISNATVEIESKEFSIFSFKDISVVSSNITLTSKIDGYMAIFSEEGKMTIDESNVTTNGGLYGLRSSDEMKLTNSIINAKASDQRENSVGISSETQITITGGNVKVKGNKAAMLVKAPKEELTPAKIILNGVMDERYKISVSDPYGSYVRMSYDTSFIPDESVEKLKVDCSNAAKEVHLAPPSNTVYFDVNGGSGDNFTETISSGEKLTAPTLIPRKEGHHFSGWYLENTKFDFTTIAITSNITLKAKFEEHVPGEEATIEHDQTCTVCGEVLKDKLPTKDVVVNESTGVEAKYEDGKVFDKNMVLSVVPVVSEDLEDINKNVDKIEKGFTVSNLYDVKLLLNNVEVQPSGKIKITIPLTETMKKMSDLKVIYVDDNGNVTIIPSELKDGKIIFVTDHFSHYGVIGKGTEKLPDNEEVNKVPEQTPSNDVTENNNEKKPETGDRSQLGIIYTLLVVSGFMVFKGIRKTKKI